MRFVLKMLGALLLVVFIAQFSIAQSQTLAKRRWEQLEAIGSPEDRCADPEACREANRKAYARIGKKDWVYFNGKDKMTGAAYRTASIESPETLDFRFPYNGGSTATLTVQKRNGKTTIWFGVNKGQVLCSIVGDDYIRVKFDSGKVQNFRCLRAADGSSNMIAFNNADRFLRSLKSAEKLLVEVTFYQDGARQIGFNVAGLEWK